MHGKAEVLKCLINSHDELTSECAKETSRAARLALWDYQVSRTVAGVIVALGHVFRSIMKPGLSWPLRRAGSAVCACFGVKREHVLEQTANMRRQSKPKPLHRAPLAIESLICCGCTHRRRQP